MNKLSSRILSALMALLLVFSLLPGISFTADAATVNYQYADTEEYSKVSNIIINWGTREEEATFLSPNAEKFYQDTTYEELAALNGSSNLTTVNTSALYVALYNLMKNAHTKQTKYDETRDMYQYTDCQNNGTATKAISAFYSGEAVGPAWDKGATWNREHVWPNSKGGDGKNEDDIMMLRPETKSNNSSRGNEAFGESSSYFHPNEKTSIYDVRGDVARIVLYTYVRWGTEEQAVLDNIWGESGVIESKAVLLKWMKEDPVDTWEMGRNDSVQSITGTRNVFVDYPELAFELFNEPVPKMTTPSGNAGGASYTITAKSNNTSYGTVSLSGNVITAKPANGYYAAGYTVTSGSATVSQNGNVFTVKATADCIVTIKFALAPKYTVQIKENGSLKSSQSVQANTNYTLPAFSSQLPDNHSFLGWSTSQITQTSQKPAFYAAGAEVTITANTTFYAVVAVKDPNAEGGTTTWNLVTNISQIKAGDQVIIAAKDYDYALGTNQKTNNREAVAIVKNDGVLTYETSVAILTLEAGTVSGTYAFNTGSGYLYAASSSNNYLKTKATKDNNGSFAITIANGTASIVAQGSYTRNTMQYNPNSGSPLFACYASASQKALSLYVAQSGKGATTYTTSWTSACSHANTTTVTVPATCFQSGSETVSCASCGEVISTKILPVQHSYQNEYIAPTLSTGGGNREYCSLCGDETLEDPEAPLTDVESWSLTLADDVRVNFKINVDSSIRSTAKIHISVAGNTTIYNVSELTSDGNDGYTVSVKVSAAQMTDEIAVQITNGADASQKKTYTVRDYAVSLLNGNYPQTMKALVRQMLHYGAAAQAYFNYKTDNLANANVETALQNTPETTNAYQVTGETAGVEFYGATLVFRDRIALRYYFHMTGDISGYTFLAGGKTLTPVQKGTYYYVEIAEINPQDLDNAFSVEVNGSLTVQYSPMNYIVNMYQKGSQDLRALVQALYDYHLAAKAYT